MKKLKGKGYKEFEQAIENGVVKDKATVSISKREDFGSCVNYVFHLSRRKLSIFDIEGGRPNLGKTIGNYYWNIL